MCGGFAAVGLAFIVFGFLVSSYPVPITITSLILYIGCNALAIYLDSESFFKGPPFALFIKVGIIVGLVKAIQAAIASENERRLAIGTG